MRIPFTIDDVSETDEAEGFVYLEDDFLIIEYAILKLSAFRQDTNIVKVEKKVIEHLHTRRRWYGDRLIIETTNIQLLREIPGKHVAGVELKTKKKHREAIDRFIEVVHAWIDGLPRTHPGPRT